MCGTLDGGRGKVVPSVNGESWCWTQSLFLWFMGLACKFHNPHQKSSSIFRARSDVSFLHIQKKKQNMGKLWVFRTTFLFVVLTFSSLSHPLTTTQHKFSQRLLLSSTTYYTRPVTIRREALCHSRRYNIKSISCPESDFCTWEKQSRSQGPFWLGTQERKSQHLRGHAPSIPSHNDSSLWTTLAPAIRDHVLHSKQESPTREKAKSYHVVVTESIINRESVRDPLENLPPTTIFGTNKTISKQTSQD